MKPAFYLSLVAALVFAACSKDDTNKQTTPLQEEYKTLAGTWKVVSTYRGISEEDAKWSEPLEKEKEEATFNENGTFSSGGQFNAFVVKKSYIENGWTRDSVIFMYKNDSKKSDTLRYKILELTTDTLVVHPLMVCYEYCGRKYARVK